MIRPRTMTPSGLPIFYGRTGRQIVKVASRGTAVPATEDTPGRIPRTTDRATILRRRQSRVQPSFRQSPTAVRSATALGCNPSETAGRFCSLSENTTRPAVPVKRSNERLLRSRWGLFPLSGESTTPDDASSTAITRKRPDAPFRSLRRPAGRASVYLREEDRMLKDG